MGYTDNKRKTKGYAKASFKNSGSKTLNKASCASCGTSCQVPFKPNGKKPVYCLPCFQKNNSHASDQQHTSFNTYTDSNRREFKSENRTSNITLEQINEKLDRILEQLK